MELGAEVSKLDEKISVYLLLKLSEDLSDRKYLELESVVSAINKKISDEELAVINNQLTLGNIKSIKQTDDVFIKNRKKYDFKPKNVNKSTLLLIFSSSSKRLHKSLESSISGKFSRLFISL